MSERMDTEVWANCYEGGWNGLIVPEAYQHPAKMSRAPVKRIFDELALPRGSLVCDPFGGIGSTGIEAASRGLRAVLVELEPVFVALAEQNFAMHRAAWEHMGFPLPVIIQGDSRELRRHVAGVDCVISSPPFTDTGMGKGTNRGRNNQAVQNSWARADKPQSDISYGTTEGQLGAMPAGSVDAVVSSPPFSVPGSQPGGSMPRTPVRSKQRAIGVERKAGEEYGSTPGQLGAMRTGSVDAVVSSPPFGRVVPFQDQAFQKPGGLSHGLYGDSPGQLGTAPTTTFWESAAIIVSECHAILKPNGIAVFVTKDFIRAKKRVPFTDDWIRLCEAAGFVLERRVRASLVKEQRGGHLFDTEYVKRTERKSFFRRLAEAKGSPPIDEEDVTFFRRAT